MSTDISAYLKGLTEAQAKTTETVKHIEEQGKKIEEFGEHLEGFAGRLEKAFAFVGITVGLKEAYEKFEKAEALAIRLEAAISVNGSAVEQTAKDYKKFAEQIRDTTAYSKVDVLTSLQRAEVLGVTGEAAKKATKEGLALAAATGMDVQSATQAIVMYQQGNKHLLQRALHLHGVTDAQELQEKIQQRLTAGEKIMEEQGKTLGAEIERSWAKIGEITKEVGKVVAEAIRPIVEGLATFSNWFKNLDDTTKGYIIRAAFLVGALGALAATWGKLLGVIKSLTVIKAFFIKQTVEATIATTAEAVASRDNAKAKVEEAVATQRLNLAKAAASLTTASWIALGLVAAYGIYKLVQALGDHSEAMERAERNLKKLNEATEKRIELNRKEVGAKISEASGASIEERKVILAKERARIDKEIVNDGIKLFQLQKSLKFAEGALGIGGIFRPTRIKELEGQIKDKQNAIADNQKLLDQIKEAEEKASKGEALTEDTKKIEDRVRELKEENKYIGLNAEQKELQWAIDHNISDELVEQLRTLQGINKEKKHEFDITTKLNDIERDNMDKLASAGLDIGQKRIADANKQFRDLEALADTPTQKRHIEAAKQETIHAGDEAALKDLIHKYEEEQEELGKTGLELAKIKAARQFATEAAKEQAKAQAERDYNLKKGQELIDKYRTPYETLLKDIDEINKSIAPEDVKAKAIEDVKKKFDDASKAAAGARDKIIQFNGSLAGTAEGNQKIRTFLESQQLDQQLSQKRINAGFGGPIDPTVKQTFKDQLAQLKLIAQSLGKPTGPLDAIGMAPVDIGGGFDF